MKKSNEKKKSGTSIKVDKKIITEKNCTKGKMDKTQK